MFAAAAFSSRYLRRLVPGIGITSSRAIFLTTPSLFLHQSSMHVPNVESRIMDLGADASAIYFDAKRTLINAADSCSEQFYEAARTVRAFWKIAISTQRAGELQRS